MLLPLLLLSLAHFTSSFSVRTPTIRTDPPPTRDESSFQPVLVPNGERAATPSFADPSKRIARTLSEMSLPTQVELLRSRLPPGYAPSKPPFETVNTQHTLEVVVGALLALTDGRLSEMQDAADTEAMERFNDAVKAATALGGTGLDDSPLTGPTVSQS